jgi:xanthine dehydrogenase accessory factor
VLFDSLREALRDRRPVALATVIDGPNLGAKLLVEPHRPPSGTLGDPDLDRVLARDMAGELAAGRTGVRHYGPQGQANDGRLQIFIESYAQPPEMLIFGAVDFTAALCRAAKGLGYRVTVCDAREVFATRARFPLADEVVVDWPNRLLERVGDRLGPADAVCVLTHDPKFDVPAIISALGTDVGYLGVMGSRTTHARRMQRLAEEGVTAPELTDRIMAPIGLDIGARTPEETAVAVCAEIISLRTGRAGGSLRDTAGPIHA